MAFKINPVTPPAAGNSTGAGTGTIVINPAAPGSAPKAPFQPRSPRPFPPRGERSYNKEDKDGVRLNERIRVPNVRLIDEKGAGGILDTQ